MVVFEALLIVPESSVMDGGGDEGISRLLTLSRHEMRRPMFCLLTGAQESDECDSIEFRCNTPNRDVATWCVRLGPRDFCSRRVTLSGQAINLSWTGTIRCNDYD